MRLKEVMQLSQNYPKNEQVGIQTRFLSLQAYGLIHDVI